jgi:hypothetical protein
VRSHGGEQEKQLVANVHAAFDSADYASVIRAMDEAYGESSYGLRNLFKDEQREITDIILDATLREVEAGFRQIYTNHAPLLRFMATLHLKPPEALLVTARFVLDADIRRGLRPWATDLDRVRAAMKEAREQAIELDTVSIGFDLRTLMNAVADQLLENPDDLETLTRLRDLAEITNQQKYEIRRWKPRNVCWELAHTHLPDRRGKGEHEEWVRTFLDLAEKLYVKVE